MMKITGLIFIVLGAILAWSGYKRKFLKTRQGQTLGELQNQMMSSDPNAAIRQGMNIGCGAYLKVMGIVGGIAFILLGFFLLVLGLSFRA